MEIIPNEIIPNEVHERFSSVITPESCQALLARMTEHTYRDVQRVVLEVASPGGCVESAMHLYEGLRSERCFELVTRNVSEVASMGNLVFLAGDKRLAAPEATFLFHPVAFDLPERLDVADLRRIRQHRELACSPSDKLVALDKAISRLEREGRAVQAIVERRTKLSGSEVAVLVDESKLVSAVDALAVGIVHEIVTPSRECESPSSWTVPRRVSTSG